MKSLLIRVKKLFFGKNIYRPDFDLDAFVSKPAIADLYKHDSERHQSGTMQKDVQLFEYFKDKQNDRFFIAPDDLQNLIRIIEAQHNNWRQNSKNTTHTLIYNYLPVYNYKAPPLNKEFPWNNLSDIPNHDTLYQLKAHRFWFAPQIALTCLYDNVITSKLHEVFSSWIESFNSNPKPYPYSSNLVVIQRIISLSWAWIFLSAVGHKKEEDYRLLTTILMIIHEDINFLTDRLGTSYPNNHLLIDYFGGWLIALIWPEFVNKDVWLPKYSVLLTNELKQQVYSDGTSFEHSSHYHEFACEIVSAFLVLNERNKIPIPNEIRQLAKRMLLYQVSISTDSAIPLQIGNATEDPLFPLDAGFGWANGALREIFRTLFDPTLAPSKATDLSVERAFWLLNGNLADTSIPTSHHYITQSAHDVGGFYSFYDDKLQSNFIFRTGPSPTTALTAGHMHSDLLSIYLVVQEFPIVLDAGTYTYRYGSQSSNPNWKKYFSGPLSHNTLSINEIDPLGEVSGDFRSPDGTARVSVGIKTIHPRIAWIEAGILNNKIYSNHKRGIVYIAEYYWITYDTLDSIEIAAESECRYLIDESADVTVCDNNISIKRDGNTLLTVSPSNGFTPPKVISESLEPLGGWISSRYGELSPAPQIVLTLDGDDALVATLFTTSNMINGSVSIKSSSVRGGMCFHVSFGNYEDVILLNKSHGTIYDPKWGITFDGSFLWIRTLNGRLDSLRWNRANSAVSNVLAFSVESKEEVRFLELAQSSDRLSITNIEPPNQKIRITKNPSTNNSVAP